jgi:hypothetical protein
VVVALSSSTRACQGVAVEVYMQCVFVASLRVVTCLHESVRRVVIGCDLLLHTRW